MDIIISLYIRTASCPTRNNINRTQASENLERLDAESVLNLLTGIVDFCVLGNVNTKTGRQRSCFFDGSNSFSSAKRPISSCQRIQRCSNRN